jgi:hypothetical protein
VALRVAPLAALTGDAERTRFFLNLTAAILRVTALTRVAAKYPTRANELRVDDAWDAVNAASDAADNPDAADVYAAGAASYAASAAADAAADADAAYDAAGAASDASEAASYAARADADTGDTLYDAYQQAAVWEPVSRDASFIAKGGSASALASAPLWPDGAPDWATYHWRRLPLEDDWEVWIDWYDRRLGGRSDPEDIELVYATVPESEWDKGPAAANRWIKERLEELAAKQSPPPIPAQGPGPHVQIDENTGAIVPAKPGSLDAEGNDIARLGALHPQLRRLARDFASQVNHNEQARTNETAFWYA